MRLIPQLAVFTLLFVTSATVARSELVHGFMLLSQQAEANGTTIYVSCGEAPDFSTQQLVWHTSGEADLCVFSFVQEWWVLRFEARHGALIVPAAVPLEDIVMAPAGGGGEAVVVIDQAYTIKTGDGLYAKFAVRETTCCTVTIEYYVQLDGSNDLSSTVPVESSSWGRIKALFR